MKVSRLQNFRIRDLLLYNIAGFFMTIVVSFLVSAKIMRDNKNIVLFPLIFLTYPATILIFINRKLKILGIIPKDIIGQVPRAGKSWFEFIVIAILAAYYTFIQSTLPVISNQLFVNNISFIQADPGSLRVAGWLTCLFCLTIFPIVEQTALHSYKIQI